MLFANKKTQGKFCSELGNVYTLGGPHLRLQKRRITL